MKKIIDGKRYDTDTATKVADIENSYPGGNSQWEDTQLYRTPRGNWFLAGEGGPASRWSQRIGDNSWSGGSGIIPITPDEALRHLEQADAYDEIEKHFGAVVEDA